MAYTALAQTPSVLTHAAVDGFKLWDAPTVPENPDKVNGNTMVHRAGRCLAIRNNSGSSPILVQPVIQRSVTEGPEVLPVTPIAPINIPLGESMIVGPFTATNFRKTDDGLVYFNWTGAAAAVDVDITVIDL